MKPISFYFKRDQQNILTKAAKLSKASRDAKEHKMKNAKMVEKNKHKQTAEQAQAQVDCKG